MRAHTGCHPLAAVELGQPRESVCHPFQWKGEREDAAAVDPRADLVLVDLGSLRVHSEHLALHTMALQAVTLAAPAMGTAQRQHPRVLAGAVVLERRWWVALGPAFELRLRGGR